MSNNSSIKYLVALLPSCTYSSLLITYTRTKLYFMNTTIGDIDWLFQLQIAILLSHDRYCVIYTGMLLIDDMGCLRTLFWYTDSISSRLGW
jgi:hypothetical protein